MSRLISGNLMELWSRTLCLMDRTSQRATIIWRMLSNGDILRSRREVRSTRSVRRSTENSRRMQCIPLSRQWGRWRLLGNWIELCAIDAAFLSYCGILMTCVDDQSDLAQRLKCLCKSHFVCCSLSFGLAYSMLNASYPFCSCLNIRGVRGHLDCTCILQHLW